MINGRHSIIDEQSNACFMSEELREQLGISGIDTNLTLSTVFKSNVIISSKRVADLEILSFDRNECISLPPVFTRECIPASSAQIPRPEIALKWPHLKSIADRIFPLQSKAKIALLIGNNVPRVMRPREIVSGGEDEPYAQKSILGWGIIGTVCRPSEQISSHAFVSNRISASLAASYPLQDLNSGLNNILFN